MTSDQIKKLRQYYHSLRGQQAIFDGLKGRTDQHPVRILEAEIRRLLIDFPDIVPAFNAQDFYSHTHDNHTFYYDVEGIRAFLAAALGRLQISIEVPSTTPVTEQKTFAFVREKAIRAIIERDYAEAQRAYISECWKSVIILCGGMIEAVLTDLLIQNDSRAKTAPGAPRNPDITRWDLTDLIKIAVALGLVSAGIEKLSHSIREYRNLVHPGNEVRNNLRFDAEEARIALEVLNIVHRDLS
jgi:hypothetical protein